MMDVKKQIRNDGLERQAWEIQVHSIDISLESHIHSLSLLYHSSKHFFSPHISASHTSPSSSSRRRVCYANRTEMLAHAAVVVPDDGKTFTLLIGWLTMPFSPFLHSSKLWIRSLFSFWLHELLMPHLRSSREVFDRTKIFRKRKGLAGSGREWVNGENEIKEEGNWCGMQTEDPGIGFTNGHDYDVVCVHLLLQAAMMHAIIAWEKRIVPPFFFILSCPAAGMKRKMNACVCMRDCVCLQKQKVKSLIERGWKGKIERQPHPNHFHFLSLLLFWSGSQSIRKALESEWSSMHVGIYLRPSLLWLKMLCIRVFKRTSLTDTKQTQETHRHTHTHKYDARWAH